MPQARNGDAVLDYEVAAGDGPPLLMIRGLSRDRRFWLGLERRLTRSFTVVVFDNRGVGKSSRPAGWWTVSAMADDAAAVIRAAGFARAHVFGMSLGGMMAQELVLRHPDVVDRLVLGCTSPGAPEGTRPPPWITLSMVVALCLPRSLGTSIAARITLSEAYLTEHPEIEEVWLRLHQEQDVSSWFVFKQLVAVLRHHCADRLSNITAPTLVLSGDSDVLIPPSNSRYLARQIPGARLQWLAGVGHDFATEAPAATAEAIEQHCLARG